MHAGVFGHGVSKCLQLALKWWGGKMSIDESRWNIYWSQLSSFTVSVVLKVFRISRREIKFCTWGKNTSLPKFPFHLQLEVTVTCLWPRRLLSSVIGEQHRAKESSEMWQYEKGTGWALPPSRPLHLCKLLSIFAPQFSDGYKTNADITWSTYPEPGI